MKIPTLPWLHHKWILPSKSNAEYLSELASNQLVSTVPQSPSATQGSRYYHFIHILQMKKLKDQKVQAPYPRSVSTECGAWIGRNGLS